MNFTIFATSDGLVDTFPDDPGARILWGLILTGLFAGYYFTARSRRRAAEHHLDAKKREQEMRDNDPDMRKDEG